jgi:hypothetical protein
VTALERTVESVTGDIVRVAVAGSSPGSRGSAAGKVRELVAEACDLATAEAEARNRKSLARAWSAYLDLFLSNRELVLDIRYGEPELWRRLCDAILGEGRG